MALTAEQHEYSRALADYRDAMARLIEAKKHLPARPKKPRPIVHTIRNDPRQVGLPLD